MQLFAIEVARGQQTGCSFHGDDASPEVMVPTVELLRGMDLGIDFIEPVVARSPKKSPALCFRMRPRRKSMLLMRRFLAPPAATLRRCCFICAGATNLCQPAPLCLRAGFNSPMVRPDGIDFAIIRENLEDLYLGLEGDTQDLAGLNLYSRHARANLGILGRANTPSKPSQKPDRKSHSFCL